MITKPSISVNKLAEYIESKGARQREILRTRKYPDPDFNLGTYHREVSEAVSKYLIGGAIDTEALTKQRHILAQVTPDKVGTARRINSNIDAIDRFLDMLDDIDLMDANTSAGSHNAPRLSFHNVQISVRPEIVLRGDGMKGKKMVGAMKLHFPTTRPLNEDAAGYVSAVVQEFVKIHLCNADEIVNPAYCQVIDVASKRVFPGVKATNQRMKDVAAECQNIAALWPSI